jgi:hypothetical protein
MSDRWILRKGSTPWIFIQLYSTRTSNINSSAHSFLNMNTMCIGCPIKLLLIVINCNNNIIKVHTQKVILVWIWQYESAGALGMMHTRGSGLLRKWRRRRSVSPSPGNYGLEWYTRYVCVCGGMQNLTAMLKNGYHCEYRPYMQHMKYFLNLSPAAH